MPTAILLAAGKGSKIWPYSEARPKPLIPVSNKPIIAYLTDQLKSLGFELIRIAVNSHSKKYFNYFRNQSGIELIEVGETAGTAESLSKAWEGLKEDWVMVAYADSIMHMEDLARLVDNDRAAALVTPHNESSRNYIGCKIKEGNIDDIIGHSREDTTHHFLGFKMPAEFKHYLSTANNWFPNVEVGMMVPDECFLEAALIDFMNDGNIIRAVPAQLPAFDIDKPWHILEANTYQNKQICDSITKNSLDKNASIDPTASIEGNVRLGKNSRIGKNVVIEGNIWVGDNTEIKHGAILKGNNVIGNHCEIGYTCFIEEFSTVGDYSKILHAAEFSGILFKRVFLYHYMEIAGIVGENTDIGAGTICGSLRFDDGLSQQKVKGRKEHVTPQYLANACYIGDYSRTGINSMLLPGIKTGIRSIVGAGVILQEDLQNDSVIFVKQETITKKWGIDHYGW